jgi:predicted short-subunit dehydrogenase-like oxidoreductase (DUF2520 family)
MRIGIIGAGKVGSAMGHAMKAEGFEVRAISDVRPESLITAKGYLGDDCLYTHQNREVVERCDIIAITTQDREIRRVAREIYDTPETVRGKLFFHTSGAHPSSILSPLDEKGAILGSLHPLQTFPDIESAIRVLPRTYIFIEGKETALPTLKLLGTAIGHEAVVIEGEHKVLYHLSAVFVCNLLCALFGSAEDIMTKIGIGLMPFHPIIDATLKNIEEKGPLMSLTGPVIRGDAETVQDHLRAMEGMESQTTIYRALSLAALDMAKKRNVLDKEIIANLEKVLKETGEGE